MEINEDEANDFARQYLFPDDKMKDVLPHINQQFYIENYAKMNHIHPSFMYVFYLWDNNDNSLYAKFNRHFPKESYNKLLKKFSVEQYLDFKPINEVSQTRNKKLNYNTL
jgi:hypothetical protein